MKKINLYLIPLLIITLLAGCVSAAERSIESYNDDDVVAIVKEKKITVGELRFLYPDDKVLENVKGTVKLELVMQEAKKMNLDVSDELNETNPELQAEKSNLEFAESQAKKLGMEPEQYFKEYKDITTEQILYMNAYIEKVLGEPDSYDEEDIKKYDKEANQLLDELVKKNENDIELLIN